MGGCIGIQPGCGMHGFCATGISMVGSHHGGDGWHPIGNCGWHPNPLQLIVGAHSGLGGGHGLFGAGVGRGGLDPSLTGGINPNKRKKKKKIGKFFISILMMGCFLLGF